MCDTGYSIGQLVADLKDLARGGGEPAVLQGLPGLLRRLQGVKHNWLRPSMCVAPETRGAAGVHLLHEEPDHALAVFVVTWLPGTETPPHDHGTWAAIAGLSGTETQHWWRRLDDGSRPGHAEVERDFRERIGPGTVVVMPTGAIHSLHNDSDGLSVSLHVYGMNVDYAERSQFDPVRRTSAPYRMGGTLAAASA
jgi:predicted metal-dependent enzyme (double-stranded beta helix superfamily)